MTAGTIIRETRTRYGISQEEMACKLGYERSMISNIEHDRRNIPDEILARVPDYFQDDFSAALICMNCKSGGFFSGVQIPDQLDGHMTELLCVSQCEFAEYIRAFEAYIDAMRHGKLEEEKTAAEDLSKQSFDLIPILLNLSLSLNHNYGTYHKNTMRKVNASVKSMINRRKEKAAHWTAR